MFVFAKSCTKNSGFNKDIGGWDTASVTTMEKMFKSARYYFRKKKEEAKPVKQRRKYISVDRDILDIIDTHIKNNHQTILSPAKCYNHFIENQLSQIQEEYKRLEEDESLGKEECVQKIKKTYKNRYFQIHNLNTS